MRNLHSTTMTTGNMHVYICIWTTPLPPPPSPSPPPHPPIMPMPLLRPLFPYALNSKIVLQCDHSPIPICDHRFESQTPYISHITTTPSKNTTTPSRNGVQCVSDHTGQSTHDTPCQFVSIMRLIE